MIQSEYRHDYLPLLVFIYDEQRFTPLFQKIFGDAHVHY